MSQSVIDHCQQQQITLAQLVEQSGLEQDRIAAILLGRWTPSPAERQAIADVLHVPINEVLWGHKTPVEHLYGHGPGGETSGTLRGI
jgi:transcriptional regulator with XRE-family HTH domain